MTASGEGACMDQTVDVMLIENRAAAGDRAAARLEREGHRVHRCHERGDQAFPCRGVTDPATCPITEGAQVALLVRHGLTPRPTAFEQGVLCALRSGLPVVEDGPDLLDPYESWIAGRTGDDPGEACRQAVDRSFDPLRAELRATTAPVVAAVGVDPASVDWSIEVAEGGIHLTATGPVLDPATRSRLAVRAADAARVAAPSHDWIDISYDEID
jgi:hypothetical protein